MADPAINHDEDDLFATPDHAADEAAMLRGLADAAAGRVVDNETVMRWVEAWSTDNPLPRPKCG